MALSRMISLAVLLTLLVVTAVSLMACRPRQITGEEISSYVKDFEARAEYLNRRVSLERWEKAYAGRSDSLSHFLDFQELLYADPQLFATTERYRAMTGDDRLRRKLDLLYRRQLREMINNRPGVAAMADSLKRLAQAFQPSFEGTLSDQKGIDSVVINAASRERRQAAYLAGARVGHDLADGIVTLARLRNQAAVRIGYNSYYDLMLIADNVDRKLLLEYTEDLKNLSLAPYRDALDSLKKDLDIEDIQLWDIEYAIGSTLNKIDRFVPDDRQYALLEQTLNGLGWRLAAWPVYFVSESDGNAGDDIKFLPVHVPQDTRIILNLEDGLGSTRELFGTAGLAMYAVNIDQEEYLLAQPPASCMEKAMAQILEDMTELESWQLKYAGVPAPLITELAAGRNLERLYQLRRHLMLIEFEKELYKDPYLNIDELYRGLLKKYLLVDYRDDTPLWAADLSLITDPVRRQNDLLATGITAQVQAYLVDKYGSILDNYHTREFLVQNFYRFGRAEDWTVLLSRGTGEKLNPQYHLAYCLK